MKSHLIASLGVAFATGIGLLQSQNVNAETPDHYGVYLESKTGQTEIVDMTMTEGEGGLENLKEHFAAHPVYTSDSAAHLLVYNPDIKPTQIELRKLDYDETIVPTVVKPLERDQYIIRPRNPFEKEFYYYATYAFSEGRTKYYIFAVVENVDTAIAEAKAERCIYNLKVLDAAKQQATIDNGWSNDLVVQDNADAESKILMYIKGQVKPQCPSGGSYTWKPIGTGPTCSVPGHSFFGSGKSQAGVCNYTLRIMNAAKKQAAIEHGWSNGLVLRDGTDPELKVLAYLKDSVKPQCPSSGSYTWNAIGADPTCSVSGHSL